MQYQQTKILLNAPSFVTPPSLSIVFIAIALVSIFCRPLPAQIETNQATQTKADPATIQRQISRLGDTDPAIRLAAQAELLRFGAAAVEELEKAAKFKSTLDYETQLAAARILESIQDTIAIEETEKFIRGKTTLEGWPAFVEFTGDSPESRSLFRDIYLRNRAELEKALRPTDDGNLVSYEQLRQLFASPDLEQVCFGMFLLARQQTLQNAAQNASALPLLPERPSTLQLENLFDSVARTSSPLAKLRTEIEPVTLLVRAIIETTPPEHSVLNSKLNLVKQIDSPEIGPVLIQLAAPTNPTIVRALAIAHAIKIGDAETFAQLRPYLNDDTVVGKFLTADTQFAGPSSKDDPANRSVNEVQVRDIVLLGTLKILDQAHTDYGFDLKAIDDSNKTVDIKRAGFANDDDRKKAFEKFQSATKQ